LGSSISVTLPKDRLAKIANPLQEVKAQSEKDESDFFPISQQACEQSFAGYGMRNGGR
jgi:hypothetical protein